MTDTGVTTEMGSDIADGYPGAAHMTYINEAGVPEDVIDQLRNNNDIANAVEKWSQSLAHGADEFSTPSGFRSRASTRHKGVFGQMAQCAWAVENDDILSTLADVVESLTFQKVHFELFDTEQEDIWNQWAGEVDLDSVLRRASRELFKVSQVYIGMLWEKKVYEVRKDRISDTIKKLAEEDEENRLREGGAPAPEPEETPKKGPGRGKYVRPVKYPIEIPTALTVFDPTKIVPVGGLMFGRERFAYVASQGEDAIFPSIIDGTQPDTTVLQMIERKYSPTEGERKELQELGVDPNRLWLMQPGSVFRHTLTKADYERFAPIRLKSALPILEMKGHLRASDRASLVGNTNFIIVITKGSDKLPAHAAEIENLQAQASVIARLPVLVGDHRLKVEIISPVLDNTLIESRWEVLDSRLVFKALQTFQPTIQGGNSSGGIKEAARVVARGLENRRHMLVRSFERHVFREALERNKGTKLEEHPSLGFSPKRIALDYTHEIIAQILKLRDRGDISRETMLEELDYDQDVEVLRRARERLETDPVFQSQTPHSSPTANPYQGNPAQQPQNNIGPSGQPRTEGGRPSGVTEAEPRQTT
jgi:hypothetical protein